MVERDEVERPFYTADLTLDDGEQTWSPVLLVQFGESQVQLHHFNTMVRLFECDSANHVEWRSEGGVKGIRMAQALIEMMVEYDYDLRWSKRVDQATENWLVSIEAADLDAEIDELEGQNDT